MPCRPWRFIKIFKSKYMYFKYQTDISIDECKNKFRNSINSTSIFVKDKKVIGTLIGNLIYLYIGFKFLEKNSFKPYFWGYLFRSGDKTILRGFFFLNFGVTLILFPLLFFLMFELYSKLSYESILSVLVFTAFLFWIIYSFKKEKKIIEEFIINTIVENDEPNDGLIQSKKSPSKKNKSNYFLIFKIVINLFFLSMTLLGLLVLFYFMIIIVFT